MKISNNQQIQDIKGDFKRIDPGLKLEFYSKSHSMEEGSKAKDQLPERTKLSEISSTKSMEDITIDSEWSVGKLEQLFEDRFGLHVQVFRKSNTLWLQTSATDHWTLKEQNRKGLASVQ